LTRAPDLTSFTAAPGAAADGDVTLNYTFPADTSGYDHVDIRRLEGDIAPNRNCSANGTVVTTITNFANGSYTDSTGNAGGRYTYRACVYDAQGNLVSTTPSNATYAKGTRHTIFVTSSATDGNIGGLVGADAKCQTAATAAGLTGTYVALLSTETVDMRDRFTTSGPIYNTVHTKIATDKADFLDGSFLNPVAVDEFGNTASYNYATGSNPSGTKLNGETCSSWTSNASVNARQGTATSTVNGIKGTGTSCSNANFAVLCLEQ
jgi:hypothetical protein